MAEQIPGELLDSKTPPEVEIRITPREPVTDPTLGVPVELEAKGTPPHRLVAVGDSLTHGFQSGAIYNTDWSYPAIIAYEMGWLDQFRRPHYGGFGGLPLNIEYLVRDLEHRFGENISWVEMPMAAFHSRHLMDQVEDWWERGPGSQMPHLTGINHNLGIYGWDLRDAISNSIQEMHSRWHRPKDNVLREVVDNANEIAAIRVLSRGQADGGGPTTVDQPQGSDEDMTSVLAAQRLSEEGEQGQDGIETLIVFLGANNALSTVTQLKVKWTQDHYQDLDKKGQYNVWNPVHFSAEFDALAEEIKKVRARHVIFATVPHVTIAPVARGVGTKVARGSRYFPYYTRPWIDDRDFDPGDDPHLTHQEARAIDSAIDQYNDHIVNVVRAARYQSRDWLVIDVAGLLDRLATRRYIADPTARPDWWTPYPLPPELAALSPVPDSRFFSSDSTGRLAGGLFALDGVHPTTIGYGILAQEIINVMHVAGVRFYRRDGSERIGPVQVDFKRLIQHDSLIASPPKSLTPDMRLIGWIDQHLDLFRRLLGDLEALA